MARHFAVEFSPGNFLGEEGSMAVTNSKRNKHLTFDERLEIQECLNKGMTFKAIASRISKDQTTVSKEVKKHLDVAEDSGVRRTDRDGDPIETGVCPLLLKAPFVCNPCKNRHARCKYRKQYYHAKLAQKEYETLLSEAREGIPLNKERFYEIDGILAKGVGKGQHLYHIMQTQDLGVSKSTVYRHLKRGYLSVSPLDFPRVVKFKERRAKRAEYVPKAAKIGRTYHDFLSFIEENRVTSWTETDTVIGRIGGKVILTLDFTFCNFMSALLLNDKSAFEAAEKIKRLKKRFAEKGFRFGDVFPLMLADNGGEFSNVAAFETAVNDNGTAEDKDKDEKEKEKESLLFFCDPYRSCQKPKVEKNHTLFRDIVPKGRSFDDFTQETVNLIFSHMNSVKRKSLGGKTPYEMFVYVYGEDVAKILGIEPIPPEDVVQSPKLLKNK
jgi:IS30 family transposase